MALLTGVNETTRNAIENLMDTFAGADGGRKYILFCTMIIKIDQQAKSGDQAAVKLLDYIHKTSKLIDVASM